MWSLEKLSFIRTLGIMPKEFGRVNHCFEHMPWSLEDSSSGLWIPLLINIKPHFQFKKGLLTGGICSHKKLCPRNTEICTFSGVHISIQMEWNLTLLHEYIYEVFCLYLTHQIHFYPILKLLISLYRRLMFYETQSWGKGMPVLKKKRIIRKVL